MRDKFNSNLTWGIFAFCWNFALVLMYMAWNIFLYDFLAFMVPFALNIGFIFLKDEHQLKCVKHHATWMIFLVVQACLIILFIVCAAFYTITALTLNKFSYL